MIRPLFPALAAGLLLAGCATVPQGSGTARPGNASTQGGAVRPTAVPPTKPPTPPAGGFRKPKIMRAAGLEGVIGETSAQLQNLFGPARLNVIEGDARKLQFTGEACVLDIFLYPLSPGAEPTATYVDARRSSDGLDVDRAACVAALKR